MTGYFPTPVFFKRRSRIKGMVQLESVDKHQGTRYNQLDLSDAQMLWGPYGRAKYETIVYDCWRQKASENACK